MCCTSINESTNQLPYITTYHHLSTNNMTLSLKSAQLKAVNRMLAFNNGDVGTDDNDYLLPPAGSSHNQWKILIYDKACRTIISPLLSVAQLRRRGVTLHLLLESEREPIPDVPVVYFCQPTKANLARIAQDCANRLYGKAHLNFVTKLDRTLMEDFAKLVVQSGSLDTIAAVHDQYLDYVCMERQLFTLSRTNSYVTMNQSAATEQAMEQEMTEIAYGLFSVVATLGYVPIIRCPKVSHECTVLYCPVLSCPVYTHSHITHYHTKLTSFILSSTIQYNRAALPKWWLANSTK